MAGYLPDYLDFELEVGPGEGPTYPVAVLHSPAGEVRGTFQPPFSGPELESRLKDIQIALLRGRGPSRRIVPDEERRVQEIGDQLLDALLPGDLHAAWEVSKRQAKAQDKGLRLRLRVLAPGLAALPWEFLHDASLGDYLCLSRQVSLVRYPEIADVVEPLTVSLPLRILGMTASPVNLPGLDIASEQQRIDEALRDIQEQGLVKLTWLEGHSWRDLQKTLDADSWHILHFIGHGDFDSIRDEGVIAFAGADGRAQLLAATQVGRLLAGYPSLRLVVLNACEGARGSEIDLFSSSAATLIRRGIPAALAMQYEISDEAAIEFSRTFYASIARGVPVDRAVTDSRIAMSLSSPSSFEWGTPVLFMRAINGQLFDVDLTTKRIEPGRLPRKPTGDSGRRDRTPAVKPGVGKPVGKADIDVGRPSLGNDAESGSPKVASKTPQVPIMESEVTQSAAISPTTPTVSNLVPTTIGSPSEAPSSAVGDESRHSNGNGTGIPANSSRRILLALPALLVAVGFTVVIVNWLVHPPGTGPGTGFVGTTPSVGTTETPTQPATNPPTTVPIANVYNLPTGEAQSTLEAQGFHVRWYYICSHSVAKDRVRQVVLDPDTPRVILVNENGVSTAGASLQRGAAVILQVSNGVPCS